MRLFFAALCATLCAAPVMAGPVIVLNNRGGAEEGTAARAAFEMAAQRFVDAFSDNVVINIDVSFAQLSSGVLGTTGTSQTNQTYASVRSALINGATSSGDASSAATLGTRLSFLSNEQGNCVTRVGCVGVDPLSRTLDNDGTADNLNLAMSRANAKALGLMSYVDGRDATIAFSSRYAWDFDPTDGVTRGTYDFVGVAAHEIAHALGFLSGVDTADYLAEYNYEGMDAFAWGSPLDLFRYTGTQRDWTVGGTPCLSATGGLTCIGAMATGRYNGNGKQASHWLSKTTGLLAPSVSGSKVLNLSANDLAALDIIGWDLSDYTVGSLAWTEGAPFDESEIAEYGLEIISAPEGPAVALFGLGLIGLASLRRRRA